MRLSPIQASISACEKGSQWIAAVQLLEDMVARRPGQMLLGSDMGLFRIWINLRFSALFNTCLILLHVLMVTSLCLPEFLGHLLFVEYSFMFVYSSVSVCLLR